MNDENVQDAVPQKGRKVPGEELMVSDFLGWAGAAMLLGPDITVGVAGLPEGSQAMPDSRKVVKTPTSLR